MILTINCGSSTIKYRLFTTDVREVVAKGIVSRIAETGSYVEHEARGRRGREERAIRSIAEIEAVGHRAVHGGDFFFESTLITDEERMIALDTMRLAGLGRKAG